MNDKATIAVDWIREDVFMQCRHGQDGCLLRMSKEEYGECYLLDCDHIIVYNEGKLCVIDKKLHVADKLAHLRKRVLNNRYRNHR